MSFFAYTARTEITLTVRDGCCAFTFCLASIADEACTVVDVIPDFAPLLLVVSN